MTSHKEEGESTILFGPNNHSNYEVGWVDVSSERVRNEVGQVLGPKYGLSLRGIQQVRGWERNSNNYKILTNAGTFLLRKNILIRSLARLKFIEDTCSALRENKIMIPNVIRTKEGTIAVNVGDHLWQLFEFIDGDYFKGTSEELRKVATGIATLHMALARIPEGASEEIATWDMEGWRNVYRRAEVGLNAFDRQLLESRDYILSEIESVIHGTTGAFSMGLIHRDLHPQNVIFKNSELCAILDFADLSSGELCRDFGNSCHRFVRQYVVHEHTAWEKCLPTGLDIFIKGYLSKKILSTEEIKASPYFIKDELLRKLFSDISNYQSGDDRHVTDGEFQKKLTLLKEASCIENYLNQ